MDDGRGDAHRKRVLQAGLRIAHWEEVQQWGWTSRRLLRELIALDYRLFGDSLNTEREGTVNQWAPVFEAYPETWSLAVAGPGRIVGYYGFVPMREDAFSLAKAGSLQDSRVTLEAVEDISTPGLYRLYFVLLGALPDQERVAGGELMREFFRNLERLAEEGVLFREVCANAFTRRGKDLCEGFGMRAIGPHKDFGTVYAMQLVPWPEKLRHARWARLEEMYDRAARGLDGESLSNAS